MPATPHGNVTPGDILQGWEPTPAAAARVEPSPVRRLRDVGNDLRIRTVSGGGTDRETPFPPDGLQRSVELPRRDHLPGLSRLGPASPAPAPAGGSRRHGPQPASCGGDPGQTASQGLQWGISGGLPALPTGSRAPAGPHATARSTLRFWGALSLPNRLPLRSQGATTDLLLALGRNPCASPAASLGADHPGPFHRAVSSRP
jgi:hypothetical protein